MKKILIGAFAALLFLGGGKVYADPANFRVFKSTTPKRTNAGVKLSNSAYLYAVQISSVANVRFSSSVVLQLYNSQNTTSARIARIQISTPEYSNLGPQLWTFETYASSGLHARLTSGQVATDVPGSVQVLYNPGGVQKDYKVYNSSFIIAGASTRTIQAGQILLHKISVLKKSTVASELRIFNSSSTTKGMSKLMAKIDLTAAGNPREYIYDVMLSSGLTYAIAGNGGNSGNADVMIFYKRNPPKDWDIWYSSFTTGTASLKTLVAGSAVFGGVVNGAAAATSNLKLYDSQSKNTRQIAELDAVTVYDPASSYLGNEFAVAVSSGLTYSSIGGGYYTIRYRRLR